MQHIQIEMNHAGRIAEAAHLHYFQKTKLSDILQNIDLTSTVLLYNFSDINNSNGGYKNV